MIFFVSCILYLVVDYLSSKEKKKKRMNTETRIDARNSVLLSSVTESTNHNPIQQYIHQSKEFSVKLTGSDVCELEFTVPSYEDGCDEIVQVDFTIDLPEICNCIRTDNDTSDNDTSDNEIVTPLLAQKLHFSVLNDGQVVSTNCNHFCAKYRESPLFHLIDSVTVSSVRDKTSDVYSKEVLKLFSQSNIRYSRCEGDRCILPIPPLNSRIKVRINQNLACAVQYYSSQAEHSKRRITDGLSTLETCFKSKKEEEVASINMGITYMTHLNLNQYIEKIERRHQRICAFQEHNEGVWSVPVEYFNPDKRASLVGLLAPSNSSSKQRSIQLILNGKPVTITSRDSLHINLSKLESLNILNLNREKVFGLIQF